MSVEDIVFEKLTDSTGQADKMLYRESWARRRAWSNVIEDSLLLMEDYKDNYAFRNIYSDKKIIGSIIVFFKKVIRKFIKWYIEPICFQQTDFNNAAYSSTMEISTAVGKLYQEMNKMNNETSNCKETVDCSNEIIQRLIKENEELKKRIETIETTLKAQKHK